jgi:hypothetical protein
MESLHYTKHAVDRFIERFPELIQAGVSAKVCLHRAFQGASLERGFMNDARFIVMMLEKYNDFNYDYYVKGDIVFACREGSVLTVMNRGDFGMQKLLGPKSHSRFRKKTVSA